MSHHMCVCYMLCYCVFHCFVLFCFYTLHLTTIISLNIYIILSFLCLSFKKSPKIKNTIPGSGLNIGISKYRIVTVHKIELFSPSNRTQNEENNIKTVSTSSITKRIKICCCSRTFIRNLRTIFILHLIHLFIFP